MKISKIDKELIIAECNRLSQLLKAYEPSEDGWNDKPRAEICRTAKSLRLNTIRLEKQLYGR